MAVSEGKYSEKNEHILMSTTCYQKQFQLACYTSTYRSLRIQFWRETSLNPVQNEVHFNPYVILVHLVAHSIFKLHLIIFKGSSGEGGFLIWTSKHFLFDIFYSYCSGGKSFPHQLWTVWFFDDFFYAFFWVFCSSIWSGYRWLRFVKRLFSKLLVAVGKMLLIHCLLFLCGISYGQHNLFTCISYIIFSRRRFKNKKRKEKENGSQLLKLITFSIFL